MRYDSCGRAGDVARVTAYVVPLLDWAEQMLVLHCRTALSDRTVLHCLQVTELGGTSLPVPNTMCAPFMRVIKLPGSRSIEHQKKIIQLQLIYYVVLFYS